ncbi:hypothetical protein LCGC14_0591270 [marine sediment metagenome]|uniref:Uncharacterized protein n=1 Tax=marine sediment metagenome TaxID=412755 RepID=A0A0F9RDA9_9ZZZZ
MYTDFNYKTKKALKQAVTEGKQITAFQPGLGTMPLNGIIYLEGPHYPASHTWYAQAELKDGVIVKVT